MYMSEVKITYKHRLKFLEETKVGLFCFAIAIVGSRLVIACLPNDEPLTPVSCPQLGLDYARCTVGIEVCKTVECVRDLLAKCEDKIEEYQSCH